MGKGNGTTRSSSSGNPNGISIPSISEALSASVTEERIPKRTSAESEKDWFTQNGSALSTQIQDTINNRVIAGDNLARVQLSRDDSGNRAIRVLHQGNPYSRNNIARERDRKMRTIAERIEKLYGVRAKYSVENTRASGTVGYISFPGWK